MDLENYPGFKDASRLPLSSNYTTYIVRRDGRLVAVPGPRLLTGDKELGRITFGPKGAKLQAVETLHILPSHSQASLYSTAATDPRGDWYELEPISDGRCEVFILRHGDVISSPSATESVTCTWKAPEVQVNSSAAEVVNDELSVDKNGVAGTPEDETEDEVAPEDTITEVPVTQPATQPSKSQPAATPQLSVHRSVLVQETPTTDRILEPSDYAAVTENEDRHVDTTPSYAAATENENRHVATTPSLQIAPADTEPFSTARTGQSPKRLADNCTNIEPFTGRKRSQGSPEVRISDRRSKKRPIPSASPEPEPSAVGRSVKRTKKAASIMDNTGDIMQDRHLDDLNADPSRKTYSAKGKKRVPELSETTPSKSQRSSQRSAMTTTADAYEGNPPRVATSNSAIKEGSATVKFLRKHGGTLVASVEDKCNVLCVRDGALAKTMKAIQAVALGVPIVTDKWLSDSAKADGLLDLSSYKPSIPEQEKEWGFELENVWAKAQTPFKGYAIYFTPALKKTYTNFREVERVCQTVGAKIASKRAGKSDKTIVLAEKEEDSDAEKMTEEGETCYTKELLTTSILRGTLDLDSDEFKITAKPTRASRRKGPRKSN